MSRPEPQGEAETEGEIHSAMRTICQCPVAGGRSGERRDGELQQELPQPSSLPLGSSLLPFDSGRLTRPPAAKERSVGRTGRLSCRLQVGHYADDRPRNRLSCNFGRRPRRPDYSLRASLLVFAGDYRDPLWDGGGRLGIAAQPGKKNHSDPCKMAEAEEESMHGKGSGKSGKDAADDAVVITRRFALARTQLKFRSQKRGAGRRDIDKVVRAGTRKKLYL